MNKLTDYETGGSVYVPSEFIYAIRPADILDENGKSVEGCSEVLLVARFPGDTTVGLLVRETPDEVHALLNPTAT